MYIDRRLKNKFNQVACEYEKARPTYPEDFIDKIFDALSIKERSKVLEIGCGTGQATQFFLEYNAKIHAIDIGENLINVAKNKFRSYKDISFEQVSFEDYVAKNVNFDIIVSAQAFHWVSPKIGFPKLHRLLNENGKVALFWNVRNDHKDHEIQKRLDVIYKTIVPQCKTGHKKRVSYNAYQEAKKSIRKCGLFNEIKEIIYPWKLEYSTQSYLNLLNTFSDHRNLDDSVREKLFFEIAKLIDQNGKKITVYYTSSAVIGTRLS